eukprot:GHVN01034638.1.p2 GENE.GHVN01034638.1~~GHVN01034638.1.p2  ORF type:complete len:117 (+),score=14.42 GHVN01034638.1:798-1148(+)
MHQRGTPPRLIPRMEEVTPTFKWNNTPEIPLPPELLTPPESAVRRPLNLTISSSSVNIASGWREKKGEGASIQPPGQGNVEHAESQTGRQEGLSIKSKRTQSTTIPWSSPTGFLSG